jgi:hypothetical protein
MSEQLKHFFELAQQIFEVNLMFHFSVKLFELLNFHFLVIGQLSNFLAMELIQ